MTISSNLDNLIISLKFIHTFKTVHCDIKPENIMFSPKYKKNVFIDFGLTKVL
jgi:serine/threonine protein kinase